MSHFSVAVFSEPNGKSIEELMAPYQENNCGSCPTEYLVFHNMEDEYREEYENDGREMVKLPSGELVSPWDEIFRKKGEIGIRGGSHEVPEGYERVHVKHKDEYDSFESFVEGWHNETKDKEMELYGYWENPNKKWDYWRVGGRCRGILKAVDGQLGPRSWELVNYEDKPNYFDSAKISDLILGPDMVQYDEAIRRWEILVEGKEPVTDEEKEIAEGSFYGKEYYLNRYKTKETYAKGCSEFSSYAVVLPDGKWYEKGKMGWWGCSSESYDESLDWDLHYKERFIDTAHKDWTLTVVDCHI